ncbi:hypothetical protein ACJJIE_03315 [Microbulbifer sp. TRSA001]|uniref:hypothetical protein n=1 Tax=Microbulbifer sp. TRSA001 TaxID=3243381 RepID=UPI00403905F3
MGKDYTIVGSVIDPDPDPVLAVADSVLKVVIDRVEYKSAVVYSSLLNLTSYLLIVLAVASCFIGLIFKWLT